MTIDDVDTPTPLIDINLLDHNLRKMAHSLRTGRDMLLSKTNFSRRPLLDSFGDFSCRGFDPSFG